MYVDKCHPDCKRPSTISLRPLLDIRKICMVHFHLRAANHQHPIAHMSLKAIAVNWQDSFTNTYGLQAIALLRTSEGPKSPKHREKMPAASSILQVVPTILGPRTSTAGDQMLHT